MLVPLVRSLLPNFKEEKRNCIGILESEPQQVLGFLHKLVEEFCYDLKFDDICVVFCSIICMLCALNIGLAHN